MHKIHLYSSWLGLNPHECIISADPGLRQGRGGAWDHRRCGACFEVAVCVHGPQLQTPAICFSRRSSLPFARPQMLLQALLPFARPQMLLRPCQGNSPSYRPQPSVFKGVQACHLPALKCSRRPCQGNSPSYRPQPSVFNGVHACRLLGLQMLPTLPQAFLRQLSQLQAPAICFQGVQAFR